MTELKRWTSADLELLPDDGKRYEIIDGDLLVSRQPGLYHQMLCLRLGGALDAWDVRTGAGVAAVAPGIIFEEDVDVAPDLTWISRERLAGALDDAGHLHTAPDLVIEILSPGAANERRDREIKLRLYSRRGVREYWIVDARQRQIAIYRRVGTALELAATVLQSDVLSSPLLPEFGIPVAQIFEGVPRAD
jgi:Uma2 family endonuclease